MPPSLPQCILILNARGHRFVFFENQLGIGAKRTADIRCHSSRSAFSAQRLARLPINIALRNWKADKYPYSGFVKNCSSAEMKIYLPMRQYHRQGPILLVQASTVSVGNYIEKVNNTFNTLRDADILCFGVTNSGRLLINFIEFFSLSLPWTRKLWRAWYSFQAKIITTLYYSEWKTKKGKYVINFNL